MQVKNNKKLLIRRWLTTVGCSVLLPLTVAEVQAKSFDFDSGLHIDWDTSLSYGAAWRVQSQKESLLTGFTTADKGFVPSSVATPIGTLPVVAVGNFPVGGGTNDDGNRNFDKGLISNRVAFITEADLQYENYGAFVRARGWYDDENLGSNDNDSPATVNSLTGRTDSFTDKAEEIHGKDVEVLDAFVYGSFDLGSMPLSVRAGQQTVNWGESLFILTGISSAQGPLDITKANVPGVEVKEIFLPVKQVSAQLGLTDTLSIEGYYQFEWEPHRLNESGSYFSTEDYVGNGAECVFLGATCIPRGRDKTASDSGQFGVALRYLAEELNDTEFGVYYINYHDKIPQLGLNVLDPLPNYNLRFAEDIELLGASFGTVVGDTNVSGEVSYRRNQPVLQQDLALVMPGASPVPANLIYKRAPTIQAQVSMIHIFGPSALADNTTFVAEVGANKVNGLDDDELELDNWGWGYTARLQLEYLNVIPGGNLSVPISFTHNVEGKSAAGQFSEGNDKFGVKAQLTYGDHLQFEAGYAAFIGDPEDNAVTDRDFVSLSAKYSF